MRRAPFSWPCSMAKLCEHALETRFVTKVPQTPAVLMAVRLAIQWMLPAETQDVDVSVVASTSAISIPNDNDFLIDLFIIHYDLEETRGKVAAGTPRVIH